MKQPIEFYWESTPNGIVQVRVQQLSTRDDGALNLIGDPFTPRDIDFERIAHHLAIHQNGSKVAGSQFNNRVLKNAKSIVAFLVKVLPASMQFDQHGRVEMTLDVQFPGGEPIGYSGIMPIAELKALGITVEKGMRMPGGVSATEEEIEGAWYPEMIQGPDGAPAIRTAESGRIFNSHGKFEPKANIAVMTGFEAATTTKLCIVIGRDSETGRPIALTAYPGELAPPFPAKIDTEAFKSSTLHDKLLNAFWDNHAFTKFT